MFKPFLRLIDRRGRQSDERCARTVGIRAAKSLSALEEQRDCPFWPEWARIAAAARDRLRPMWAVPNGPFLAKGPPATGASYRRTRRRRLLGSAAVRQGPVERELVGALDGLRAAIAAAERASQGSDLRQHRQEALPIYRHRLDHPQLPHARMGVIVGVSDAFERVA